MKQIMSGGGGGGGGFTLLTEEEVEVVDILVTLPKIFAKWELISRYSFSWGFKKKRSVLFSKSESSPSPLTERRRVESVPEKVTAVVESDKSPSTPLCFLRNDGGDKRKPPLSGRKSLKRKAANDLMESYNRMQQEKEILRRETKAMKTLHQQLTSTNLELKSIMQKVSYSRNIEDFHQWNKSMKIIDQQSYHPQITMFAPPTTQHCQQRLVVDPNNGKLMAVSCSSNSHSSGGFGLFNQIDPRVKIHHGEVYDFMGCSQPLDQSKYMAAAARKRRIMRMKENKIALLALKLSRGSR